MKKIISFILIGCILFSLNSATLKYAPYDGFSGIPIGSKYYKGGNSWSYDYNFLTLQAKEAKMQRIFITVQSKKCLHSFDPSKEVIKSLRKRGQQMLNKQGRYICHIVITLLASGL